MECLHNTHVGAGLPPGAGLAQGEVASDPAGPLELLRQCPVAARTPLHELGSLAAELDLGELLVKDETRRMGLGSFKALGAAHAIARAAAERAREHGDVPIERALEGTVYACASAGNHGLSVAAGARVFGARAVIYLADSVPEAFAERLRSRDAEVVRPGGSYEQVMRRAAEDARERGWILLSDSSWPGYVELPARVMEGYLVMAAEVADAVERPPTHVFLQAGVGGMAAAVCALFRARWGAAPTLVVVEPEAAPALIESIRAGTAVAATGPASAMGRLDCKEPSHLALAELARGADWFATISEDEAAAAVEVLRRHGIPTTPSGAAGLAAVLAAGRWREPLGLGPNSRVLVIVSEGTEDAA